MTITIADNTPRISYSVASGSTTTSFAIPFEFFDDSDLNVYVDGTAKSISTHYTVSGGSGSTGSIAMSVTGISGGSTVVISRAISIERVTDFTAGADINRAALNTQLDTLTAIAADQKSKIDRSLILADFDDAATMTIPIKADRLGKLLGFNLTTGLPEPRDSAVSSASVSSVTNLSAGVSPTVTVSYVQSTGNIAFAFGLPQGATGNAGSNGVFSSIASKSEAEAGTNTTKGMNPLRVKEAITFNAGSVSNAAFYGFKIDSSNLKVDTTTSGGSEAFTDSDYPQTIMNATGLTFSINTAGHLLLTTP